MRLGSEQDDHAPNTCAHQYPHASAGTDGDTRSTADSDTGDSDTGAYRYTGSDANAGPDGYACTNSLAGA